MARLLAFLSTAAILATVYAEQVTVMKLPKFIHLDQSAQSSIPSNDFIGAIKGMAGLPVEQSDTKLAITTSGLNSPKYFIFLQFAADSSSWPQRTFGLETPSHGNLKTLLSEISSFYGPHAYVLDMESSGEGSPVEFSAGITEVVEAISLAKPFHQNGPVIISSPVIQLEGNADQKLENLSTQLAGLLGDEAAVFAIVRLPIISRSKRQAVSADPPTPEALNVGKDYSEMYPVIFNIILWFSIAMGLTIASVAYCIWFMDPGKDGIIYRMTASRIKKDL